MESNENKDIVEETKEEISNIGEEQTLDNTSDVNDKPKKDNIFNNPIIETIIIVIIVILVGLIVKQYTDIINNKELDNNNKVVNVNNNKETGKTKKQKSNANTNSKCTSYTFLNIYKCSNDYYSYYNSYYSAYQSDSCKDVYKKIKVCSSDYKIYDIQGEYALYKDSDIYIYDMTNDNTTKLDIDSSYEKYKFIFDATNKKVIGIMAGNLKEHGLYDHSTTFFYNLETKKEMYKGKYDKFNVIDNEYIEGVVYSDNITYLLKIDNEETITLEDVQEQFVDEKIKTVDGKIDADTTTTGDISEKVSLILTSGTKNTKESAFDVFWHFSMRDQKHELNQDEKIYIILNSLQANFKKITSSKAKELNYNCIDPCKFVNDYMYLNAGAGDYITYIDALDVSKKYEILFGEKIKNYNYDFQNVACAVTNFSYKYDSENNVYYYTGGSGGTVAPIYLIHKDRYIKDTEKIYAYISIATWMPFDDKVYKGIDNNDESNYLYTKNLESSTSASVLRIKEINENHDKYEHYRMVFQKDENGNYYYSSIEKVD